MIETRDREDFDTAARNFRSHVDALAARLMDEGSHDAAGRVLVLERLVYAHANVILLSLPREPEPVPSGIAPRKRAPAAGGKRAPAGEGAHRHKFNSAGDCALYVAGKLCGAKRQRAPRGQGERPSAEARTAPLPLGPVPSRRPALGEHADDPYEGGAFGSSGTGDRRP